jgi:sporulation-control protein
MFKKLLASIGVGSAEVDTRLHQNRVMPGGMLSGDVHIRGGDAAQEVEDLSLFLMTEVEVESGDSEWKQHFTIQRWPLARNFMVRPKEQFVVPFQLQVHPETPITEVAATQAYGFHGQAAGKGGWGGGHGAHYGFAPGRHGKQCKVWIHTGLSIDDGVDASDRDFIAVAPTPPMERFLTAIANLGFQLVSADVERGNLRGSNFQSTIGCYQEIEYRPMPGSRYYGRVNEVEVSFVTRYNDTGVLIEADQRFRRHDSYRSLLMSHQNFQSVNWEMEIARILESPR